MTVERLKSSEFFTDNGFPLKVWRVNDHFTARLHRHEFHELVLIIHGNGRHLTDYDKYPISAGDVFLLHGNMQHGYDNLERMNLINVLFNPRQLELPLSDLGDTAGYQHLFRVEPRLRRQMGFQDRLRLTPEQMAEAMRLIALLEQELEKRSPGYRFSARAHLMHLVVFLSRCFNSGRRPADNSSSRLGEVLSYLDSHCREPITVAQLTEIAHMSESKLIRAFHHVFQRSPIDYLIRLRIQKACEMLVDPELRVTEAALACGFNDSNYFTRQFRRVMGCSPREYRGRLGKANSSPAADTQRN